MIQTPTKKLTARSFRALCDRRATNLRPLSYGELVNKYGAARFSAACKEAKTSPLSVQAILERDEQVAHLTPEQRAHRAGMLAGAGVVASVWFVTFASLAAAVWPTLHR